MHIVTGTADTLSAEMLFDMAHYRHQVFVEKLGWDLSVRGRLELDQFDRRDTLYVLAPKREGGLRGVARLLPTDRPYLLAEVFPQLLGGRTAPRSARIWELSRFAAVDLAASQPRVTQFGASSAALSLLAATMQVAAKAGAEELVTVSPLGMERILQHAGIAARRFAAPVRVGRQRLFACRIDLMPCARQRTPLRPTLSMA